MRECSKIFLVCILTLSFITVSAQDAVEVCSSSDISARADEAINGYQTARSTATSMDSALFELDKLQSRLDQIQNLCANISPTDAESNGNGTLQSPYTFGTAGEVTEGMTIQITGLIRPADQIIRNENMFNDTPGEGEVYVIVEVAVYCDRNFSGRCETNYFDYEMVGDLGTIYDMESVVYENKLDVGLFAGGTASGGLPFLVRASDTNLKLLYRENIFDDEYIAFEAMPSQANGIEITSSANLNVRSGPGTNYGISGSLPTNQTDIAFGRNSDGSWLQISLGWVLAELVTTNGSIEQLPVIAQ